MHVQVRTSDGRIYDTDVDETAQVHELLVRLFAPNPVPRNSSIMARTRLLDPRERVANVMHNDLFLVGPKPDVVHINKPSPTTPHQNSSTNNSQYQSKSSSSHHHQHRSSHHHHTHHASDVKEAVHNLEEFVASPQGSHQPTFQQPPLPPQFYQQQQPQQQQPPQQQHRQQQPQQQQNNIYTTTSQSTNRYAPSYQAQPTPQQQQQHQQQYQPQNYNNNNNNNYTNKQQQYQQQQQPQQQRSPQQQPRSPQEAPPPQSPSSSSATATPAQTPKVQVPKTPSEILVFVRDGFAQLDIKARAPDATAHDRLVAGEESMRLLYKLDALDDIGAELKVERKRLVKEIQALQDWVDSRKGSD